MGTWGYGIRQDDFVCDLIDQFENLLKSGSSVADAIKEMHAQFSEPVGKAVTYMFLRDGGP